MRQTQLIGALLTATSVALCLLALSCSTGQQTATTAAAKPDPVVRGRYLVTIMSCNDCHTPGYFYGAGDTLRRLSGSDLGWVGPWGAQLAPIMPWMNYSSILDEDDAMAIASYLKSLPPVVHKNLDRIPPDKKPTGLNVTFPRPPAWDVPPGKAPGGGK